MPSPLLEILGDVKDTSILFAEEVLEIEDDEIEQWIDSVWNEDYML
jgi:hypothetical protein